LRVNETGDPDDADRGGSPPCLLNELGPDGAPLDARQASDVARWRKAERARLLELRSALPPEERARHTAAIAHALDGLVDGRADAVVSLYWPIRAEPDLRPWMRTACERGLRVALPVAIALGRPMTFREWRPGAAMTRGLWKIPHPAEGLDVSPTHVIAPLVGFDAACYRLGYGGGFFDRTLAAMEHKPTVIGVGYPQLRIATIFPQPHDIPMDWIVSGGAPPLRRSA
jgi:5-formyltetrahydrofolate cyclo-ligase